MLLGLMGAVQGGCRPVQCGAGTVLVDRVCESMVECGPGTVEFEGDCVPDVEPGDVVWRQSI